MRGQSTGWIGGEQRGVGRRSNRAPSAAGWSCAGRSRGPAGRRRFREADEEFARAALLSGCFAGQVSATGKFGGIPAERSAPAAAQRISGARVVSGLVRNGFGEVAAAHRGVGSRGRGAEFRSERDEQALQSTGQAAKWRDRKSVV